MNRRDFMIGSAATALCGAVTSSASRSPEKSASQPLKQIAADKGIKFGAAATQGALSKDPEYAALFARECGMLVTEREFKWSVVHPAQDRYDFRLSDWMLDFARNHDQLFRGHALAGNQELPAWTGASSRRQEAVSLLQSHITTITKRYAGKVYAWTVINEAIALWDKRPDGLRNTPWLQWIGPEYIELAFHAASEADPHAQLIYNDNKLEYNIPEQSKKRQVLLTLLTKWKKANMPLHALGIQAHLKEESGIDARSIQDFLRRVSDLGLKIFITECDVTDQDMPTNSQERDKIVADMYRRYLDAVLQVPSVVVINTWGLSDRYTWLSTYAPRRDNTPVRPLPFDSDLQPKPAYDALRNAMSAASPR
jgi:endo-1,4-beta-xylanase